MRVELRLRASILCCIHIECHGIEQIWFSGSDFVKGRKNYRKVNLIQLVGEYQHLI